MMTKKQMIALWLCLLNEATQIELPFVIAVFMVRRWLGSEAQHEDVVGRMTGILAASFPAAQFVSAIGWGRVSDKHGRQPLLVMSNVSSMLAAIGFGLAPTWGTAILARIMGGLFNCTFLNFKAMLGESCEPSEQGRVMSFMGATWGVAAVLAPLIGGFLAEPCSQHGDWFPFCAPGALLQRQPFLLPCLAAALLSCCALFCSSCLLQETLPSLVATRNPAADSSNLSPKPIDAPPVNLPTSAGHVELTVVGDEQPGSQQTGASLRHDDADMRDTGSEMRDVDLENAPLLANMQQPLPGTSPSASPSLLKSSHATAAYPHRDPHTALPSAALAPPHTQIHAPEDGSSSHVRDSAVDCVVSSPDHFVAPVPDPASEPDDAEGAELQALLGASSGMDHGKERQDHAGYSSNSVTNSLQDAARGMQGDAATKHRWYRDTQVQLTLVGYSLVCFVYILFDEMVPMYSSAPARAGGLALNPSQLALPLIASGPIMFAWSIWGYPILESWLGGVTPTMRWNLAAAAILTPSVPFASALVPWGSTYVLIGLGVSLSLCRMVGNNMFSCASGMINLAAPKAQLGRVNATGSMLSAGVRSVGPALGGFIWGSSVGIPAHQYAVFSAMSGILVAMQLVYLRVRV